MHGFHESLIKAITHGQKKAKLDYIRSVMTGNYDFGYLNRKAVDIWIEIQLIVEQEKNTISSEKKLDQLFEDFRNLEKLAKEI